MSKLPFEYLDVSTMTVIIPLMGNIENMQAAMWSMDITRIKLPPVTSSRQKMKVPYPGFPGAILSAKMDGTVRGIVRGGNGFKNSITMDVSTTKKNINIKLSSTCIHVTGTPSEKLAYEGATYVVNNLKKVQGLLNIFKMDSDKTRQMIEWVETHTRGDKYTVYKGTQYICEDPNIPRDQVEEIYSIIVPPVESIPVDMDHNCIVFLLDRCYDFARHDIYCKLINKLATVETVISDDFGLCRPLTSMVNYNYDVGFPINRWNLAIRIEGNGFIARYENVDDNYVTIQLPYTIPSELAHRIRKKPGKEYHTFLVYKSGLVTQSSPCVELARQAYHHFNTVIREIKPDIIKRSDDPRKAKIYTTDGAINKRQQVEARLADERQFDELMDRLYGDGSSDRDDGYDSSSS